ncbi:DUF4232 domain-containing protein [Streptantibioticus parmotrematis]|uniref:DUF4232 domain-containing protein n=1 Tax=Streptantibioticus parmotrematis TaxID=2873249 RepID=UPI0033E0A016
MFGNRRKAVLVSAALVGSAMMMTACQNGPSNAAQASPSSPVGTPLAPSGSSATGGAQSGGNSSAGKSSAGQGTAGGSGSTGTTGVGGCRTDELRITATDDTIGGDPTGSVAVELKNVGGRACSMAGFAGVDLKTDSGTVSARRTGQPATPITLRNGQAVYFGVTYPFNKTGGTGIRITGLLVTPPNETKTVSLNWPGAPSLPVTDGTGSPVRVGPLGSAGQGG